MDKIKDLFQKNKEIIMYLIFGVLTTAINWICYIVCTVVCGLDESKLQLTISNAIAWTVAVILAFVTNKLYVFESKDWTPSVAIKEGVSFIGARLFTGMIEILMPAGLMSIGLNQAIFGVEGAVAKAITSVLVIILNYVFSKLLVFRTKKNSKDEAETVSKAEA